MGTDDGEKLGANVVVGDTDGAGVVGVSVGAKVGSSVGFLVGSSVGLLVGTLVGDAAIFGRHL